MAVTRSGDDRCFPNVGNSIKGEGSQSTQPIRVHPRPHPLEFGACRDDVGIGEGMADAKVTPAELDGYKATIATDDEQAQWMQEGYDSAK